MSPRLLFKLFVESALVSRRFSQYRNGLPGLPWTRAIVRQGNVQLDFVPRLEV